MSSNKNQIKQDFVYAHKAKTKIFKEQASKQNGYVCEKAWLHGYDYHQLIAQKGFVDVLLLLFKGEFAKPWQTNLFERLMIALINPGPRHPAVKAAMVAGVSKANPEHLLPIGLSVLGGAQNGAKEVAEAMAFIKANCTGSVEQLCASLTPQPNEGEYHVFPGFGNQYGDIDVFSQTLSTQLADIMPTDAEAGYFAWANQLALQLASANMGWLKTGLAAAVFLELGLGEREGAGIFQLLCAPGIFAHGIEQSHHPITAIPMLSDDDYLYQGIKP